MIYVKFDFTREMEMGTSEPCECWVLYVVRHVLLLIMSESNYLGNYCRALYIHASSSVCLGC